MRVFPVGPTECAMLGDLVEEPGDREYRRLMRTICQLFRVLYRHQAMILAMVARDLQSRYVGTLGGILWTFAHPLAVIVIFYFVFTVGFRSQGPDRTPFLLWFVCGMIPWFFFNESLMAAATSITSHAHLIKKTIFPSEILPVVSVTAGLVLHSVFLFILAGMLVAFDVQFAAGRLLIVYFLFCTCVLSLGLGWLLSAVQVFYRDVSHVLSIVLNLWFWVTPIVWPSEKIPSEYRGWLFCNPMYYIIEGYRGLLIFNKTIWPSAEHTAYFWGVVLAVFWAGAYVFGRLKPEFVEDI
jgi:lipopolysaccharide transport system permease protein/teichoic acid transport system permease protein